MLFNKYSRKGSTKGIPTKGSVADSNQNKIIRYKENSEMQRRSETASTDLRHTSTRVAAASLHEDLQSLSIQQYVFLFRLQ